jgi:hypothetical protein
MKRFVPWFAVLAVAVVAGWAVAAEQAKSAAKPAGQWSIDGTIIEACSCPMFCTCYFGSGHPAAHHDMTTHAEEHFCRFNNVYRVDHGHFKDVKLDGAKFWVAGDLGGEFAKGGEWGMLVFDKAMTPAQREAIGMMMGKMYPLKWGAFSTGEGEISWTKDANGARATLDGGKGGEVSLVKGGFGTKGGTPVIKDLQYWGSDSNDGFVLMPNTIEAFREGSKPFEYKESNGFMITVHLADHGEAAGSKGGF